MDDYLRNFSSLARGLNLRGDSIVYTAIFDAYDELSSPQIVDNCVDYVCFTNDRELVSDVWKVVLVQSLYRDPRRTARLFKFFPHLLFKDHRMSVWVDGGCQLKGSVAEFITKYKGAGISCFPHPDRKCAYKEAEACRIHHKDDSELISSQVSFYKKVGFPKEEGLIASGVLLRESHLPAVIELMNAWAKEVDRYSSRDQISFNYCVWNGQKKYSVINLNIYSNDYFRFSSHSKLRFYDSSGKLIFSLRGLLSKVYLRIRAMNFQ